MNPRSRVTLIAACALAACAAPPSPPGPLVVSLDARDGAAFAAFRAAFTARNPGYDVAFARAATRLEATSSARVVFVQNGATRARVVAPGGEQASDAVVGDVAIVRAGCAFGADAPLDLLVFTVPEPPPAEVPAFVRPDFDPRIADQPGGCATDARAYRRIALTWSTQNGPYTYRALNAHRVLITDSFTHYHPRDGGFDEIYLVQRAGDSARLLTSVHTDAIVAEAPVTRALARELLQSHALRNGDLVYLPRGTVHRGTGGVLAHVITVPGFVPGAEIGVDHHLARINERLGLEGEDALPLHAAGASAKVVR